MNTSYEVQLLTYLRLSNVRLQFLINFFVPLWKMAVGEWSSEFLRRPRLDWDELRLSDRPSRRPQLGGPATATPLGD